MYIFKKERYDEVLEKYKMTGLCKQVGLSKGYFSLILNGRKHCPKTTAYCITKYFNEDAEIEDYFDVKEK